MGYMEGCIDGGGLVGVEGVLIHVVGEVKTGGKESWKGGEWVENG